MIGQTLDHYRVLAQIGEGGMGVVYLKPRAVIAGHKRVGNADSPTIIGETRKYIRDFERLAMQTTTARELFDQMLNLYPDRINRGALWSSVRAIRT